MNETVNILSVAERTVSPLYCLIQVDLGNGVDRLDAEVEDGGRLIILNTVKVVVDFTVLTIYVRVVGQGNIVIGITIQEDTIRQDVLIKDVKVSDDIIRSKEEVRYVNNIYFIK